MIIFGGADDATLPTDNAAYDPSKDSWTAISSNNAPEPRKHQQAVWTDSLMLIWGGTDANLNPLNTGAAYDPATDSWSPIATLGEPPDGRYDFPLIWTGQQMMFWGGLGEPLGKSLVFGDGWEYNPDQMQWTKLPPPGVLLVPVHNDTAVWTGTEMIVWGGTTSLDATVNFGARFSPSTSAWSPVSLTNAPSRRTRHSAVWTGSQMIIFGGVADCDINDLNCLALSNGGSYTP